jgi:S1-C subfamily serine protease
MKISANSKNFLLGFSFALVFITAFFLGGLSDRVFVLKPLDYLTGKRTGLLSKLTKPSANSLNSVIESTTAFSVPDIAEKASESVVTVSIKKKQNVISPFQSGIFGFTFGVPTGEVKEVKQDIGTGFVVDQSGLIVTNKHVVGDASAQYSVIDKNDKEYPVSKIFRDPTNDLAIIKIDAANLPALDLGDSDKIRVGESVIAIGTALGEFRHTVTTGVVSGLGRGIQATDLMGQSIESLEGVIQTDAAINPGNSGGPLINALGEAIGVNVAVSAAGQNVGFALPINIVKTSLKNFNETGQFDRPFFGVSYRMISQQAALLNEVPQGAYVAEVGESSSAAEAGLKVGDIITEFDGQSLKNEQQNLAELINKKKIGDKVSVTYWRQGETIKKEVTLKGK